jgi:hypothetical protein
LDVGQTRALGRQEPLTTNPPPQEIAVRDVKMTGKILWL